MKCTDDEPRYVAPPRPLPPLVYEYTTDEGIPLDIYYEYEPEEKPVYHGPGICAGAPEYIYIYKITFNNYVDLPIDSLKALMGAEKWEAWERDLKACIKQQIEDQT